MIVMLFIFSIVAAFFGFVIAVALGKEGLSNNDLYSFLLLATLLFAAIITWTVLLRKFSDRIIKVLGMLAIVFMIIPLLLNSCSSAYLIYYNYKSKQFAKNLAITHYQESFITWPGFTYPVGLHVEIELPAPFVDKNYSEIYSPQIWMGPPILDESAKQKQMFSGPNIQINEQLPLHAVIKQPGYQEHTALISLAGNHKKIIFDLYPAGLYDFENTNKFCFTDWRDPYSPAPVYSSGTHLNSIWYAIGKVRVDLSSVLTPVLQRNSQLENNPTAWNAMHQQFQVENLVKLGYHQCPNKNVQCYCR